jgi:hypothetical protein
MKPICDQEHHEQNKPGNKPHFEGNPCIANILCPIKVFTFIILEISPSIKLDFNGRFGEHLFV